MSTSLKKNEEEKIKTKWQQIIDKPKGSLEFNPNQTFALQVLWIVRSPRAVADMIKKGFQPCSEATKRDTPTTLMYLFRVSRDQTLAKKYQDEIKTIGQHPHYSSAFKSIKMGLPRASQEVKMNLGGINTSPLSWDPEEPILPHAKELDFDPVLLECTEVYLDNRGFYEHSASRDWFASYPNIMSASYSLKPRTICVGTPDQEIWEKTLESYLKAELISNDSQQMKKIQPGVFVNIKNQENQKEDYSVLIDLDLVVDEDKVEETRSYIGSIQKDLDIPLMVVIPYNGYNNVEGSLSDHVHYPVQLRVTYSFKINKSSTSSSFTKLKSSCQKMEGKMTIFNELDTKSDLDQRMNDGKQFLARCEVEESLISIVDGVSSMESNNLAGYILHPLSNKLISNENSFYKI